MNISNTTRLVWAIPWLAALGGCATLTPELDRTFGDAVNMARTGQAIDRDAALKNANKSAAGLDGIAAKEVIDRYQKSFRSPDPPPNVFAIGVSSGSNTSGGQNP
jgi:hypothetical protein